MKINRINLPFIYSTVFGFFALGFVLGGSIFANENLFSDKAEKIDLRYVGTILVAIFAAMITFWNSIRQNSLSIQQKQDEIDREIFFARTTLLFHLSSICDYVEECLEWLKSSLSDETELANTPKLPTETIEAIGNNVRYSEPPERDELAKLARKLQVQIARIRSSAKGEGNFDINYADHVYDAIEIYVLSSNLFDYARSEKTNNNTDFSSAYRILWKHISKTNHLQKLIEQRIGDDFKP